MNDITHVDFNQVVFTTAILIGSALPGQIRAPLFRHLMKCGARYGLPFIIGLLIGALIGKFYPGKGAIHK